MECSVQVLFEFDCFAFLEAEVDHLDLSVQKFDFGGHEDQAIGSADCFEMSLDPIRKSENCQLLELHSGLESHGLVQACDSIQSLIHHEGSQS